MSTYQSRAIKDNEGENCWTPIEKGVQQERETVNAQGGMTSFGWDDVTGERHVTGAEPSTRRRDKKVAGQ